MFHSFDRISKLLCTGFPIALVLLAVGCGYNDYETRLNESRKYYLHLEKIEQALARKWTVSGNVMDLRVPRQFNLIPAPQAIKKEDGTIEMPAGDDRQPSYVNLTLPGLYGAWEAAFTVARADGSKEERKGYIYVLSNYEELAGEHAVDAGSFVESLKSLLTESLGIAPSDERVEIHPKVVPAYQAQLTYDAFTFKGKNIDGVNYTFEVYARTQGSVIAAILIVLPEGMESPQKVSERIPMMLESFTFTKTPPKAGSAQAGGAAQPAAAPTGF